MSAAPRQAWRLLVDPAPLDGPTNMAVDAALLASIRRGAPPVLRLYRWDPATLSFGRNQPARGLYDEASARERGIAFVRRPTGGQAVLHDDELTYAVVAPVSALGRPREAYRRVNAALVAGLRRLGLEAESAGPAGAGGAAPVPGAGSVDWSEACFARPAPGEVVVAGRKLVGSAQRCEGRVILQHGSILVGGSQAPAEALLLRPVAVRGADGAAGADVAGANGAAGSTAWTTLTEALGRPTRDEIEAAIVAGFAATFGIALAPGTLAVEEARRARELREQYASPEWTWRR